MTSYVQPLDAGIIRCVKAHYRRAFCLRAIELDDAGEDDIYKINLLEVMLMVKEAWKAVTPETITNCWNHTKIQNRPIAPATSTSPRATSTVITVSPTPCSTKAALADNGAWGILQEFANGTISSLPQTESRLEVHLGDRYRFIDWKPAFDAVFAAEDDVGKAISAIETLEKQARTETTTAPTIPSPTPPRLALNQLTMLENDLMECVTKLGDRKRIRGTCPTLEDLLNPVEEREIGESDFLFPGGDGEIIAKVIRELQPGGDVEAEEIEGEESDGEQEDAAPSLGEGMELCERLEKLCVIHSEARGVSTLLLQQQLRKLRAHLHVVQVNSARQTSLDSFFNSNISPMDVNTT